MTWGVVSRPGYFGRKRDEKIASFNREFGEENWRLVWMILGEEPMSFVEACARAYEASYWRYFETHPEAVDFVCSFTEVIDNAPTNVNSKLDYTIQESYSTHIQDIAIRNFVYRSGRKFLGTKKRVLVVRSADSEGWRLGPGNVPFYIPELIHQPSLHPKWANVGSVEDFWQSNKFLQVKR